MVQDRAFTTSQWDIQTESTENVNEIEYTCDVEMVNHKDQLIVKCLTFNQGLICTDHNSKDLKK